MSEALNDGRHYLDSREVEERIEELTLLAQDDAITCDEEEELEQLCSVRDEVRDYGYEGVWEDGVLLVHDNAFEEYAEDSARDLGLINSETEGWPFRHIDWTEAAEELKQDFTQLNIGDNIYYGRTN